MTVRGSGRKNRDYILAAPQFSASGFAARARRPGILDGLHSPVGTDRVSEQRDWGTLKRFDREQLDGMNDRCDRLQPASLWSALRERTGRAIACGALHSIETETRILEDAGVRFLVRSVSSLQRKDRERRRRQEGSPGARGFNPFLPPEPELTLGAISDTHLCVLNKFNVLEHHLLIVTRAFEHQESLLTRADFEAQWCALQGIDGLGFYNGGAAAGASQTHKHLQLVPLPLVPGGPDLPMEPLLAGEGAERLASLPFGHASRRRPPTSWQRARVAANRSHQLYREMLEQVGIRSVEREGHLFQSAPYNLLLRRDWMLLVPRLREQFRGIAINALGYAGSLFVRDAAELEWVVRTGPMRLLAEVAGLPGPRSPAKQETRLPE
jgi:ATP adenylyltransferase